MKNITIIIASLLISMNAHAVELGAGLGMRNDYAPYLAFSTASGYWGKTGFCAEYVVGSWYDWQQRYAVHHTGIATPAYTEYGKLETDKLGINSTVRVLFSGERGARARNLIAWITVGGGIGYESRTSNPYGGIVDTWTLVPVIEQVLRFSVRTGVKQEIFTELVFREAWYKPPYHMEAASTAMTLGVGYRFSVR